VINFVLSKSFSFPKGDASIWFHTGLLMVIIGTYWVEHYFTRPSDVVINGLVVIIATSSLSNPPYSGWWNFLFFSSIVLVVLSFIVVWSGSPAIPENEDSKIKKFLYLTTTRLGSSKILFSFVFLLSLLSYFDLQTHSAKLLVIFWIIVLSAAYLDLDQFYDFFLTVFDKSKNTPIGSVTRVADPRVVRFKLRENSTCPVGSLITLTTREGENPDSPIGISIGSRVSPDEVEIEALMLEPSFPSGKHEDKLVVRKVDKTSSIYRAKSKDNLLIKNSQNIIGFASKGSKISNINFELIQNPGISEGNIVYSPTNTHERVYFQIIDGSLREELSIKGSERALTVGEAEQVGLWKHDLQCFESFDWVMPENSPVFRSTIDDGQIRDLALPNVKVGTVPDSGFPANVNINDIVMYHTAILGVTGCGKTFLAFNLIEQAIDNGIKIIAIDVSGDYGRYLNGSVKLRDPNQIDPFLDSNDKCCAIVEPESEKRHPVETAHIIAYKCLDWCKENRSTDEILDPEPKLLLVFEEAHVLIPEWNFINDRKLQGIVNKTASIGLQARKFGLGFMVISQRTANVTKSILNQCNSIFAFQAFDETGFDFLKNYLGQRYVNCLPNLKQRRCVVVGQASRSNKPLIIDVNPQDRRPLDAPVEYFTFEEEET
jgi:hypothetical protein